MDTEKPVIQQTIDELRADAKSPEDHAYLDAEQAKLSEERLKALGGEVIETPHLVQLPDGSTATKQEVEAVQARGEEPSGPYNAGRRS